MNSLPVMVVSAAVGGMLAGPALAGMYDTVLRALRDEAGYWWTTYRKAFKRNFKSSHPARRPLLHRAVTLQIFLVYFCFNMLYHGTNVGLPHVGGHRAQSGAVPDAVLPTCGRRWSCWTSPSSLTLKNSLNCMIAFLPHALAAAIVTRCCSGASCILCMPLGLFLMLIFGFWFQPRSSCQIVYGDIDRVFHIEENIQQAAGRRAGSRPGRGVRRRRRPRNRIN